MKILSACLALLVLIPVVAFALSNPAAVDVGLWPFDTTLSLPLFAVGLVPLAAGLLLGGLWGWVCSVPHRLRARRLHKELAALKDKIGGLQPIPVPETLATPRTPFWRRRP